MLENHNGNIISAKYDENNIKTENENLLSKEQNSDKKTSTKKSSETRKFAFNSIFTFEIDFHGLNFFKRNQFRK